ncbi:hypothetical protein Afe04nite_20370 [Asanoa ferruginea]|nr:hypothetical protein Afe04nite_20370 [Asanoa ferruginea]
MPYLLGFHPHRCVVCVGVRTPAVSVLTHQRLPETDDEQPDWDATATIIRQQSSNAFVIGYGPAEQIDAAVEQCAVAIDATGTEVTAAVRVDNGRIYCLSQRCQCPPEGWPYNPDTSTLPAEATLRGIAPLPDRAALTALLDPVTGDAHDRMQAATEAAMRRFTTAVRESSPARTGGSVAAWLAAGPLSGLAADGIAALHDALAAAGRGERLDDDAVAWLSVVLLIPEVFDHAWRACDGSDPHRTLWIDVTRRAAGRAAAPPACLLAITAYLGGNGALTDIALQRVREADPSVPLAHAIGRALQAGVPPHLLRQLLKSLI